MDLRRQEGKTTHREALACKSKRMGMEQASSCIYAGCQRQFDSLHASCGRKVIAKTAAGVVQNDVLGTCNMLQALHYIYAMACSCPWGQDQRQAASKAISQSSSQHLKGNVNNNPRRSEGMESGVWIARVL